MVVCLTVFRYERWPYGQDRSRGGTRWPECVRSAASARSRGRNQHDRVPSGDDGTDE